MAGLDAAERFFKDFDGAADGLIRGALPDRIQTCAPASHTAALSRELNAPMRALLVRRSAKWRWLSNCAARAAGVVCANWTFARRAVCCHGIYTAGDDDFTDG